MNTQSCPPRMFLPKPKPIYKNRVFIVAFFHWNSFLSGIDVYTNKTHKNCIQCSSFFLLRFDRRWSERCAFAFTRSMAARFWCARGALFDLCVLQQRRRWRRAQRLALLELDGRNSQWNNWKIDHQQHFYMEYHLIVFCFIRISVHVVLFVVSSRSRRYFCVHLISACACTLTRAFRSLFLLFL